MQHRRIAKDFANYLDLYRKYRTDYRVDDILQGSYTKQAVTKLEDAPFDEKCGTFAEQAFRGLPWGIRGGFDRNGTAWGTVVVKERFNSPYCKETPWENLFTGLVEGRSCLYEGAEGGNFRRKRRSMPACVNWSGCISSLRELGQAERLSGKRMRLRGEGLSQKRRKDGKRHCGCVCDADNAFAFLEEAFGAGQEMVILLRS